MILLEGLGTNVSEKLYFEASNASKLNLWLKCGQKSGIFWLLGGHKLKLGTKSG